MGKKAGLQQQKILPRVFPEWEKSFQRISKVLLQSNANYGAILFYFRKVIFVQCFKAVISWNVPGGFSLEPLHCMKFPQGTCDLLGEIRHGYKNHK